MNSVGEAANVMVKECMTQYPSIIDGSKEPDYVRCAVVSTKAPLGGVRLASLGVAVLFILIEQCDVMLEPEELKHDSARVCRELETVI